MTFEPIDWPDEYEAAARTAADKARAKLGERRRHQVFGRVLVEHLLAEHDALAKRVAEQSQDERDARIAELERELRDLRGTELNPSPTVLDAQAYGELRDEIAATMTDDWDSENSELWILIQYVRWLAAGQPRDEDGHPVRRETYPAADQKTAQDEPGGDMQAYPGKPGDIWQDCDDDHWILGSDGNLHLIKDLTDPYDPAVIKDCYAPMVLNMRNAKGGATR